MDTKPLKDYAPVARRKFIEAVTAQATKLGITSKAISEPTLAGDLMMIEGQPFPKEMHPERQKLVERVKKDGFEAVIEAAAYTWFNRLVAIRYMELHNYLDHGYRVLSHPEGEPRPEILDHVADLELDGLDKSKAIELKLAGTKDEELYRLILMGQGNALHKSMPFLFERLGEVNELLLPANLLYTDSVIRQMVEAIKDDAWQQIEIIGWLYQYYISEKKDQVIGKVVKPEDIPAATQLFTPNWIVKYMVQNSLGAQWLATYPDSVLRGQMEYYIEPAEQTPEVHAHLKAITPDSLNPEEITLIDPACGSGHILVEAYDLFKAIYQERGYRQRDIPQLILEKNLFGLDIDQRAAQLAGFALMMKGRADDRRLFDRGLSLNVMAFVNSTDFDPEVLAESRDLRLADFGLESADLKAMKKLFEHATTFGSLIQVPEEVKAKLDGLSRLSRQESGELEDEGQLAVLHNLAQQAQLLVSRYDVVVANPPYMGSKGMNGLVKKFVGKSYQDTKADLFACFIKRGRYWGKEEAFIGVVAPFLWMFLSSYEKFRRGLLDQATLFNLTQLEYNAFEPACVPIASFVFRNLHIPNFEGSYIKLSEFKGHQNQAPRTIEAIENPNCGWMYRAKADDFKKIPGSPVAYWASEAVRRAFNSFPLLSSVCDVKKGMDTGDNIRFLRYWFEVDASNTKLANSSQVNFSREPNWRAYNKGGSFRKWFGNQEFIIAWGDGGASVRSFSKSTLRNENFYFRPSVSWTDVSSAHLGVRFYHEGFIHDSTGPSIFGQTETLFSVLSFMTSVVCQHLLTILSPSLHYQVGSIARLPFADQRESSVRVGASRCVEIAGQDWNGYEASWSFQFHSLISKTEETVAQSYAVWNAESQQIITEMKRLEEENNRLFIDAYGLQDELTPEVPIEQITLTVNPAYRYPDTEKRKLTDEERQTRFRQDTMRELVSYTVGCMMGRYSLDEPGLIYAHSGNEGFDPGRYQKFPADEDGIIPLTDTSWFEDDAAHRLETFLSVAWPAEHLEENLSFLADNLSPNKNESSRDTIRRYLCDKFFTDHCQTYKKRPIYWLFSSGKQKGFQALVYLHRYNEGTLARMRSEYVIPLQGKMAARLEQLKGDIHNESSSAHRKRLEKEQAKLEKQQTELLAFDEKLRHYADQRIALDLDDGVKVNYGKFGDLLADVKKICGDKE